MARCAAAALARAADAVTGPAGQPRRDQPAAVRAGQGRRQRIVVLLRLPVPAPAATRSDHRVLRLLPRGRRRGRRDRRRRRRRRQAGLVAQEVHVSLRRAAEPPGDAGADAAARPSSGIAAGAPAGGDRRLARWTCSRRATSTMPGSRTTATWWLAWSARSRRTSSAAAKRRTVPYAHRLGPGHAADEHHPRRRRRRAARPHLPADVRAAALRRQGAGDSSGATRPGATASASTR